jgi:hypothetical protein
MKIFKMFYSFHFYHTLHNYKQASIVQCYSRALSAHRTLAILTDTMMAIGGGVAALELLINDEAMARAVGRNAVNIRDVLLGALSNKVPMAVRIGAEKNWSRFLI